MARFLQFTVWLLLGALLGAAQCSATCLVSACPAVSAQAASPCHHAPGKKSPECPLKQSQLHRSTASVDVAQHADMPLGFAPASPLPEVSASANLVLHGANVRGAPPGSSLLLLLSTLRL